MWDTNKDPLAKGSSERNLTEQFRQKEMQATITKLTLLS